MSDDDPIDPGAGPDEGDEAAMEMIRAAAGRSAPLGELRARGIVREALGRQAALEEEGVGDGAAMEMIRAASGRATPLGEVRALGIVREAARKAKVAPRRRRWELFAGAAMVAAAAVLVIVLRPAPEPLPDRLCSRSAGMLVPGPFPDGQTAAERLDLVAADRLVAYRELRARRVR